MTNLTTEASVAVALLDDDSIYREYVGLLLSKQRNVVFFAAATVDELLAILDAETIDCVLLDYNLGQDTGLTVHALIEERYPNPPPTVMLTGDGRERTVIKAMRLGIRDYLPKRELKIEELVAVVQRTAKRHRQDLALKAEHRRLVQLSGVDTVSGLLAREPLDARLAQLDGLPHRARVGYGLILVEMAELNGINERFGIGLGDRALRAFAQRLRLSSRQSDICGRYAGGTFLYIVDSRADRDLVATLGEQLLLQTDFRVDFDEASLHLTSHIGSAIAVEDGRTTECVLAEAQRRLREAKESGRRMRARDGATVGAAVEAAPEPEAKADGPAVRTVDARRSPRQRVLKRGQIVTSTNGSTIDCTLRNISQTGAALRFDMFFALPEEFDLMVGGAGQRRRVRVRWQSGVDVGVQYLA